VTDADAVLTKKTRTLPKTEPFKPPMWFGLDMFPHIDGLKCVMLLERSACSSNSDIPEDPELEGRSLQGITRMLSRYQPVAAE
jgi:hypothetical protein